MNEKEQLNTTTLRKVLQRFNEDLGQYINSEERYKLGRVLTIVDASIADPEQRKAIKDLVHNEWWNSHGMRASEGAMISPHSDLRAICRLFGFELYERNNEEPLESQDEIKSQQYIVKRYKKVATEE